MFRKKWFSVISLIGCLMILSGLNTLWAAESDVARLIELLKSKNIITQPEADLLLKEVKETAKKEQKELEEIKTAAKSNALPAALKGFKFGTTIFGEWKNRNSDSTADKNNFNLNRTHFTFLKDVNDWLSLNLTADLYTSMDADDNSASKGNGMELRVKVASVNLKFLDTTTMLGSIPYASNAYDESIWPYRVQGKNILDDLGIQSTNDIGIANQGVLGGYMDDAYLKFASKPFAGKWGGWFVGVYNGGGYTVGESNDNKVVSGVVYLRPLPTVPVLKGLQLAYAGTTGESNSTFSTTKVPSASATDYPDFHASIAQVSLQHEYFTIMGQYYVGKGTATATDDFNRNAYQVDGFLKVPGCDKTRIFSKYQRFDIEPNATTDDSSSSKLVAGFSYDFSKEFMPFFAYEKVRYDFNTTTRLDYDQYQLGFQLKL